MSIGAPTVTQRYNLFRTADIGGHPAPGYSTGEAMHALQEVAAFACRPESDLHHLPFRVQPSDVLAALVSTTTSSEAQLNASQA